MGCGSTVFRQPWCEEQYGPSDTDRVISGNKAAHVADRTFYTSKLALFQPISAVRRAKTSQKSVLPVEVSYLYDDAIASCYEALELLAGYRSYSFTGPRRDHVP